MWSIVILWGNLRVLFFSCRCSTFLLRRIRGCSRCVCIFSSVRPCRKVFWFRRVFHFLHGESMLFGRICYFFRSFIEDVALVLQGLSFSWRFIFTTRTGFLSDFNFCGIFFCASPFCGTCPRNRIPTPNIWTPLSISNVLVPSSCRVWWVLQDTYLVCRGRERVGSRGTCLIFFWRGSCTGCSCICCRWLDFWLARGRWCSCTCSSIWHFTNQKIFTSVGAPSLFQIDYIVYLFQNHIARGTDRCEQNHKRFIKTKKTNWQFYEYILKNGFYLYEVYLFIIILWI